MFGVISPSGFCFVALVTSMLTMCKASPDSTDLALSARQLTKPNLPSSGETQSCDEQCGILTTLDNCETDQCFCSDTNSDGLASCLDCIVATGNGTTSQGQTIMNEYIDNCADLGFTVKTETIQASGAKILAIPTTGIVVAAALGSLIRLMGE
ncbi:hypothetical protein J3R30DRAFT_1386237 [Lentinula aciculospora]|uniref:Extracellular membrane protein CFEM domain-containing protein n=1 Tax=Lentinula aciculospora TaxID=153920 RepID=A0A9W9AM45_9AGAR|nr:hypothetical protein J3R30DRAFT_1386237 [Lentinula aciculospora]